MEEFLATARNHFDYHRDGRSSVQVGIGDGDLFDHQAQIS
jgi:hypothetical protein